MLIRSQNKVLLVTLKNCCAINFMRGKELYLIYAHDCSQEAHHLGNYSTREKAIKVLDMIQEKYLETTDIYHGEYVTKCSPRAVVFQMPQDSEV